ncbi:MAG: HyaD/HybD family hydrogenase maturation endopeptidase [Thermodesulfobacteriota bacterium]
MWNRIAIIGLGNLLLSDEGIGVHVVSELQKEYDLPEELSVIDGGTLGLDLLPIIEGKEKIIFIDATDLQKEPGTIAIIEDENLPSFLAPKLSLHHVGLADLLFASTFQGNRPAKVILMGIQPAKLEVGLSLSETLTKKMPEFLEVIIKKLREWNIEIKKKAKGVISCA